MALISGLATNAIGALLSSCVGGGGSGADLKVDSDPQTKRKRDTSVPGGQLSQLEESNSLSFTSKACPPLASSSRIESEDMDSLQSANATSIFSHVNSNASPSSIPPSHELESSSILVADEEMENVPFVNHGLMRWNEQRREWIRSGPRTPSRRRSRSPAIRASTTYDELLGTSRPFSQPIPLSEMIAFLVDSWDEEGLYG